MHNKEQHHSYINNAGAGSRNHKQFAFSCRNNRLISQEHAVLQNKYGTSQGKAIGTYIHAVLVNEESKH